MNASPRLSLSIATGAYDRVQALRDGRVTIEGCDHTFLVAHQEQIFLRGFHSAEYDVCELSMSSYMISVSRGKNAYVAVPVFTSRLFRHSAIYINTAAGIVLPEDLAGKAIGVPEYQLTAALWCRGLLDDEYGVPPSAMRWFRGGLHQTGRVEKLTLDLPPEIKISDIGPDDTLNEMLCTGTIDALMTPRTPKAFLEGDPRVARLFPNYRTDEKAYFRKTGIVPIMHVLAIRRELVERHPWLANAVADAFVTAKKLAVEAFSDVSALRVTLPWFAAELDETRALMGPDFWPYGVEPNRKALSMMIDYAYRHGTVNRRLRLDEIFAPSTLIEPKI